MVKTAFIKLYKIYFIPTSLHIKRIYSLKLLLVLIYCVKTSEFGKNVNITEILTLLTWTLRTQKASIVLLFSITIDILYLYE
jgi:hypothetical protein